MKKFLIINGSPREKGNSDYLSDYLMDTFDGVKFRKWRLRESIIGHCDACDECYKNDQIYCRKNDDFLARADWILKSDGILIITPVYQGGVTALVKAWMDRCEMFRKGRRLKNKICGGIAIGGYAGGGQELTLMQIQYFAHITAMKYAASWGRTRSHLGGHCIAFRKQEIIKDREGIVSCENVLKNMMAYNL